MATAWTIVQTRDRVVLIAVGTVPDGTAVDSAQGVLGKFVVPRASVTFAGSVMPEVNFTDAGTPLDTTAPTAPVITATQTGLTSIRVVLTTPSIDAGGV